MAESKIGVIPRVLTAGSLFLTSCAVKAGPIVLVEPTNTPQSELNPVPAFTNTPFPPPSPSETATAQAQPTATPTPTPTATSTPTLLKNKALKNMNDELFSVDTTSELVKENYAFTLHLSKGLLKRSGLNYVNIPDNVLDKMFLQSTGRFMYFLRDFYPDKYSEFFSLAEEITTSETKVWEPDYTSFIELAKPNFDEGSIPVQFNNAPISGMISKVEMNLVSKDEFLNIVVPTLDKQRIANSRKAPCFYPGWDTDVAAFIEGNKLVIYSYNLGLPEDRSNPYHKPIEIQESDSSWSQLYGILEGWKTATVLTQINFTGHDYSSPLQSRFDPGTTFVTENGDFICGLKESERTSWENHCKEVLNQTFIPGYQP